jgi:hypothetical protein
MYDAHIVSEQQRLCQRQTDPATALDESCFEACLFALTHKHEANMVKLNKLREGFTVVRLDRSVRYHELVNTMRFYQERFPRLHLKDTYKLDFNTDGTWMVMDSCSLANLRCVMLMVMNHCGGTGTKQQTLAPPMFSLMSMLYLCRNIQDRSHTLAERQQPLPSAAEEEHDPVTGVMKKEALSRRFDPDTLGLETVIHWLAIRLHLDKSSSPLAPGEADRSMLDAVKGVLASNHPQFFCYHFLHVLLNVLREGGRERYQDNGYEIDESLEDINALRSFLLMRLEHTISVERLQELEQSLQQMAADYAAADREVPEFIRVPLQLCQALLEANRLEAEMVPLEPVAGSTRKRASANKSPNAPVRKTPVNRLRADRVHIPECIDRVRLTLSPTMATELSRLSADHHPLLRKSQDVWRPMLNWLLYSAVVPMHHRLSWRQRADVVRDLRPSEPQVGWTPLTEAKLGSVSVTEERQQRWAGRAETFLPHLPKDYVLPDCFASYQNVDAFCETMRRLEFFSIHGVRLPRVVELPAVMDAYDDASEAAGQEAGASVSRFPPPFCAGVTASGDFIELSNLFVPVATRVLAGNVVGRAANGPRAVAEGAFQTITDLIFKYDPSSFDVAAIRADNTEDFVAWTQHVRRHMPPHPAVLPVPTPLYWGILEAYCAGQ